MIKQAPTFGRLAGMIVFSLSCFGLLLYLWTTFGGPTPLAAKGYRFSAHFDEATTLADNADVRVSGVKVGRVIRSELARDRTRVEIEIESRYAPVPRDTRAILRQKTLLGETFVEITPGDERAGPLPDGGELARGLVRPTVELDEVLRVFDEEARRDLQRFLKSFALTLRGRGEDLNDALGSLDPFATDTNRLVKILDEQRGALRRVVSDSGTVFEALGRRHGELEGLVRAGDRVLQTTARRDRDLAETIRILPTTLRELRPTFTEIEALAGDAAPVVRELRPAARALAPALANATELAPQARGLFLDVDRVAAEARDGLPAATRTIESVHPFFRRLPDALRSGAPIVDYLGLYKRELVTQFSNPAAATQGRSAQGPGSGSIRYLRALAPSSSESFVAYPRRLSSNRHNPYLPPSGLEKLPTGLESFACPEGGPPSNDPSPPCKLAPLLEFRGRSTRFTRVEKDP